MTDFKLGEVIVAAAVAKLKTGMTARVNTINSAYQSVDGVQITRPRKDGESGGNPHDGSDYYTAFKASIPLAPAILVMEGPMSLVTEYGGGGFEAETKLEVYVLEEDADTEILGKKLRRQARAVMETIIGDEPREQLTAVAPFAGQQAAFRVHVELTRPGRAFEETGRDDYRQFYRIVFSARSIEG